MRQHRAGGNYPGKDPELEVSDCNQLHLPYKILLPGKKAASNPFGRPITSVQKAALPVSWDFHPDI
jgi:hypothetical protein